MRLMREGLEGLATEVVYAPADQVDPLGLLDLDPDGEGQVLVRRQAYRRPEALDELQKELTGRRPQRGARITDDQLREVAMVYRAALAESEGRKAPTEAVRDMFTISRSTAGRWVEEARRRGFLGPAPGRRRAGEAGR